MTTMTTTITVEDLQPIHQTLCKINDALYEIQKTLYKMTLSMETNKRKRKESEELEGLCGNKRRRTEECDQDMYDEEKYKQIIYN